MAKVVWTAESERWLLKIHDYIAKDSPAAAFNVVKSLYAKAQSLAQFPALGHRYTSASGRETRILLWGHYRIVYVQSLAPLGRRFRKIRDIHTAGWSNAVAIGCRRQA